MQNTINLTVTEPQDVVTHSLTEKEISVEFGVNTKDAIIPPSLENDLSDDKEAAVDTHKDMK